MTNEHFGAPSQGMTFNKTTRRRSHQVEPPLWSVAPTKEMYYTTECNQLIVQLPYISVNMRNFFEKNSSGVKVLSLFVITNCVYLFMLMVTIPIVEQYSAGLKILDMMPFGYDLAYVTTLFMTLGENGRHAYLWRQIPVDMIYPILFALSSSLILAYLLKKLGKLEGILFLVCFIPLVSGLFDYAENTGVVILLNEYPHLSESTIRITSVFSLIKSMSTMCYFTTLIILMVILGWRKILTSRS